ncbi:MAG: WecB/TagA/CpsF family glycosyltransferase [Syntrophales bacterium]|nr:WecB/TagA/CpsF family glycosyltransferase [Syntrophales bacterium]
MSERIEICGMLIDNVSMSETVNRIKSFIRKKEPRMVITPNVDHVMKFQRNEAFRDVYRQAALVLADGMPLLWAARYLKTPLKEKVSGSDLFPLLCRVSAEKGYKVFFMGGRAGAADKAAELLSSRYPGLQIAGICCPPMGFEHDEEENRHVIECIKKARPDIVFVGLGAPKQEFWIHRYKKEYGAPVSIGIGVSFEFTAGMVKRAPVWMQHAGLEWSWRILMEPKRMWRRYLLEDTGFFLLIYKQKTKRFGDIPGESRQPVTFDSPFTGSAKTQGSNGNAVISHHTFL